MSTHLKALLTVSAFLVFFVGVYFFFQWQSDQVVKDDDHIQSVTQMEKLGVPGFKTQTFEGEELEFEPGKTHQGQVVIINFWASWCTPCIEEIPSLLKLAQNLKEKLLIVAISGDNNIEDIQVFLKAYPEFKGANIKVIWDKDRSLTKLYKVQRLPESFVVRPDGKLDQKVIGSIPWYTPDSVKYLEKLSGH